MDAKRRKTSRSEHKGRARPQPAKLVDEESDALDEDDNISNRRVEEEESISGSGSEEASEEEDGGADDHEGDDDGDESDESSEPPPPPSKGLTFGQLLKSQSKPEKSKKSASTSNLLSKGTAASADAAPSSAKDRTARPGRAAKPARAHKHAPAEQSSRFAVRRGHDWASGDATIAGVSVKPAEARARDPRFFLASMAAAPPSRTDELRAQRNYAFLDEYRDNEARQMRADLQQAEHAAKAERRKVERNRNAAKLEAAQQEVERLRRELMSVEARKRDRAARDKAAAVLEEHKKRERELVRQGKTPYFLKRSEQKKRLLVDKFAGMSDEQAEKAIARRRKKVAAREWREMPVPRKTEA